MKSKNLHQIISIYQPISLNEIDAAALMDRVDSKFVFNVHQLFDILSECINEYRILEINSVRNHFYDSVYFDTRNFALYLHHHNQRLNRYKVRFRKYVTSNGLTFFEIKYKDNKQKTYKKRKKHIDIEYQISAELKHFLMEQSLLNSEELFPTLKIKYNRITLVHKNLNERVTLDTQLEFDNFQTTYSFNNIVIAEVKRNSYSEHTTFLKLLHQHHIREGGLSKYCTGVALTYPNIKKNNFLTKLRYFEKINKL